jgi:hypothetical protein
MYRVWNGDCPKVEAIVDRETKLRNSANCEVFKKTLVTEDFGKLSEFAVLGGLAGERADALDCSSKQIGATLDSADATKKIVEDALGKVLAIAKDRDAMKPLVHGLGAKDAISKLEGEGSMNAEYRKLRARSDAALSSMSFVELPEYKDAVESAIAQVQAFDGREVPPSTLESIKSKLGGSLVSTRKKIDEDRKLMHEAYEKTGTSLNTNLRESLLQDQDLVASYLQHNKEDEKSLKSISCRLDAKYGKGANYRDTSTMVGSAVLTGPGWATVGKIGLQAIRVTHLLTRGTAALRSANILKFVAVGVGETGNLANTIQDIHKSCDGPSAQYTAHNSGANSKTCDTNVVKALDSNNCYLAHALGALGAVGTGAAAYSKVNDKFATKVAEKMGRWADPARAVLNSADEAKPNQAVTEAKVLTQADRQTLSKGLDELLPQTPLQDLKVADPSTPLKLSANEIKKSSIANYMSRNQKAGVEYVFDDAKFAGKSDVVLTEGNRIILRRKDGLHQLDSATSREAIVKATEKVVSRIQCEKTRSPKDCAHAITYRAGYDSKIGIKGNENQLSASDREALYKSGRMARNPDSVATAEKMAEEEAMILQALKKKWVNGLSDVRDDGKKVLKETVHLSDGREIEVDLPYGTENSFAHFKQLVDQRLSEAPVVAAAKRNETRNFDWLQRRAKLEAAAVPYKPTYKVVDGKVVSDYQPTRVIPRSAYPSQRTDAQYGGRIFRSLEELKKYRASSEWRDGVHPFIQIREKDASGKDVIVWMEAHRIPTGKDFDEAKIVTHRTLAAEYERQTGHPPVIVAGGEYIADETRTLKEVGDGMGGYHDKEIFTNTANFSADHLLAQGLRFAAPTDISTGTLVKPFKASDGSSQMVGHLKAAFEVEKARDLVRTYPALFAPKPPLKPSDGFFEKARVLAKRMLEADRKFVATTAQRKAWVVKFMNSPEVKADPDKFEAYRMIANMSKLMNESSTMAVINTVEGLHLHPKLKRDIPGALKLIDKYQDEYFRDMEKVSREATP